MRRSLRDILKRTVATMALVITAMAGKAASPVEATDTVTASGVFASLSHEVLDMLRPTTRLDMIDYYVQADSLVSVQNALGGESRLEQVTDDYLKVRLTPVSTLEIKVLPYGREFIVMTLYSVGDDDMAADTAVDFFDSSLRPLPKGKFFKAPAMTDFFLTGKSGISAAELGELLPFAAVRYSIGEGDSPLEASFTSLQAIADEDRSRLVPLLRSPLKAEWNGKSFIFKP